MSQNQLGLFGIRTCVNVINLMLISVSTLLLWHIQEFSYEFYWESDKYEQLESIRFAIYFLPQIFIVVTWMMLSVIVERVRSCRLLLLIMVFAVRFGFCKVLYIDGKMGEISPEDASPGPSPSLLGSSANTFGVLHHEIP